MDSGIIVTEFPEKSLLNKIRKNIENELSLKGFVSIALSGGSSPMKFYSLLAEEIKDWENTHIFQVDERCVSPEHNDSNQKMIRTRLLAGISIPAGNIHLMNTGLTPQETARDYEIQLNNFFETKKTRPLIDIILLGIGADGHTASVFPENRNIFSSAETVINTRPGHFPHERTSLSLSFINKAKYVYFLVKGKDKTRIIKEVIDKKNGNLPASRIDPSDGELHFILDKEASLLYFPGDDQHT